MGGSPLYFDISLSSTIFTILASHPVSFKAWATKSSSFRQLTPLLHKDVVESTACPHQKAVSNFLRITSKGHSWIDPGDDIDLTAIFLWVRV
jgi:hypothetical protein